MKRFLLFLFFPATLFSHDLRDVRPIVPEPKIIEANPPDPQTNTFCASNLACTVTGAWSFSSLTLSGNFNATAGQNLICTYQLDQIVFVDGGATACTGPKFTTIEAAQTYLLAGSPVGGLIWVPSGFRETFTSTITLGSSTKSVILWLQPDSVVTCNVTGSTDCFDINPTSGIRGHNVGSLGTPLRTSGAIIYAASTAVVGNIISPVSCAVSGGNSYITLTDLWIEGNSASTVGTSLNLCSYNNFPLVENLYIVSPANAVGVKIHATTTAGNFTGPNKFKNIFSECLYRAGCRPAQIVSDSGTNQLNVIDWDGGYIVHPGPGLPALEINGNGATSRQIKGIKIHAYLENAQAGTTLTTSAASLTANVVTLTLTTNPLTGGYVNGSNINVAGFTGADTFFNGVFTATSVTSTQIQYADVHANGTATTTGTITSPSLLVKIVDATNVDLSDSVIQGQDIDTCVDISQSAAGRVGGIHMAPFSCYSSTGTIKIINNHLSGYAPTGGFSTVEPFYNFGGDGTLAAQNAVFDLNTLVVNGQFSVGALTNPVAQSEVHANASLVDVLELFDTEGSGKNVAIGPGEKVVGRFDVVDKSDSNTSLVSCNLSTAGACAIPSFTVGAAVPNPAANALTFTEVAAPSGSAGNDVCYGDSTAHQIKCSFNNGGFANSQLTLKKGSGAGNYTNATTSYAVADSSNLCFTVTIPTGWKLGVSASGGIGTNTAAVVANVALTDNAACATANAGILVETQATATAAAGLEAFALNWVITGDGAAHNVAVQFKTSNGADTAILQNSSATLTTTMKFELMPSN